MDLKRSQEVLDKKGKKSGLYSWKTDKLYCSDFFLPTNIKEVECCRDSSFTYMKTLRDGALPKKHNKAPSFVAIEMSKAAMCSYQVKLIEVTRLHDSLLSNTEPCVYTE